MNEFRRFRSVKYQILTSLNFGSRTARKSCLRTFWEFIAYCMFSNKNERNAHGFCETFTQCFSSVQLWMLGLVIGIVAA